MAMSWVWSRSDWELTVLGLNRGEMGSPNTWERGGGRGVSSPDSLGLRKEDWLEFSI